MDTWYSKIKSEVVTQIEYMLKTRTDAPYPSLKITTVSQTVAPSEFPTLYLRSELVETGQDLDNATINAVNNTVIVQVWTNKGQTECEGILNATIAELKRMRYNIPAFPVVVTDSGISWGTIRARRIIGAADTL